MNELATLKLPRKSDVKTPRALGSIQISQIYARAVVDSPCNRRSLLLTSEHCPVIRPYISPCMLMQDPIYTVFNKYAYRF